MSIRRSQLCFFVQEAQFEMKKSAEAADLSDLKLHLIFYGSCFDPFKGPQDELLDRMENLTH